MGEYRAGCMASWGECTMRVEFADYGVVALVMRNDDKV